MGHPEAKPNLGKELRAMTGDTGAAIVTYGDSTFVLVEFEREAILSPETLYQVTDPEEAADLRDALVDDDNPSFSSQEALQYLKSAARKRTMRG